MLGSSTGPPSNRPAPGKADGDVILQSALEGAAQTMAAQLGVWQTVSPFLCVEEVTDALDSGHSGSM